MIAVVQGDGINPLSELGALLLFFVTPVALLGWLRSRRIERERLEGLQLTALYNTHYRASAKATYDHVEDPMEKFDVEEATEDAWEEIQAVISKYTGNIQSVSLEDHREVLLGLRTELANLINAATEDIALRDAEDV